MRFFYFLCLSCRPGRHDDDFLYELPCAARPPVCAAHALRRCAKAMAAATTLFMTVIRQILTAYRIRGTAKSATLSGATVTFPACQATARKICTTGCWVQWQTPTATGIATDRQRSKFCSVKPLPDGSLYFWLSVICRIKKIKTAG